VTPEWKASIRWIGPACLFKRLPSRAQGTVESVTTINDLAIPGSLQQGHAPLVQQIRTTSPGHDRFERQGRALASPFAASAKYLRKTLAGATFAPGRTGWSAIFV